MNFNWIMQSQKFYLKKFTCFLLFLCSAFSSLYSFAQPDKKSDVDVPSIQLNSAPVNIDGVSLFNIVGISSFPAEMRARTISNRIERAAGKADISADSILIEETEHSERIFAANEFIMNVYDPDADAEGISRKLFAQIIKQKITLTINSWRHDRSKPVVLSNILHASLALVVMTVLLFILLWLIRRINRRIQNRIKARVENMEAKTFRLIKSEQLWKALNVLFRTIKAVIIILIVSFTINYILSLFPWTRNAGIYLMNIFLHPFVSIWQSMIAFLPNLGFLVVIFLITRYIFKLIKMLFTGIRDGGIHINNFDAEWAIPTFRILRMFLIAFAVIVAYPYIPGSESSAFKGVTVFIGILFSLGSSSFISNLIAGYSMTYRRAFKIGDRIKVDNIIGYVEEQKLLTTRMRSFKNEEIIIPNSTLLNSSIINYNVLAKNPGVIVHATIGIGYETPWRHVDAMLKEAADRTEGLLKDPPPYVLKHLLGDFAVQYEINAYCNEVNRMHFYYSNLIQNILDVFNENNVQIMTPAYEGDPEIPKVVAGDMWNPPLAKRQTGNNT
jgi:small-conductance mechanosensitive channel